ncbi:MULTISPECIES: chemotaxis protein CheA [Candidatus Nitrosocaldus]|jgi:two-component system chemotaxis sensor kinase CheA|uniref:Chemotaxis protein CheA n=1 Tax=Candidatus Nitrosocaldus cavascurensis TaxID=2058097 RepID=A0A2K5ASA6_9ARCH|nr:MULTISPECIES: chemotaxis protein CheA [Candidatus Nitrosocaldus]SPC34521.1 Chemotaxis protein histidine kinase-like protein [Candidatus Nitrosocaldus cavascurensis]
MSDISSNKEYRELFVIEANEHIQNMNNELLAYEQDNAREHIDSIFRSVHTLKGMAGTMGYENIRILCKTIENVLDALRNGRMVFEKSIADTLFQCFDILSRLVNDEHALIDISPYISSLSSIMANENKTGVVGNNNGDDGNGSANNKNNEVTNDNDKLPTTITVKLDDLDRLVDLVGELVIAKSRLRGMVTSNNAMVDAQLTHLDRLISDLQYSVMKLRLVPLSTVFSRFPRLVRDTASKLGKEVRLEIEGSEIEVDRSILQAITDPLVHMIRNAIDHGIEDREERISKGKEPTGLLRIAASKVEDRISITVEDDGKGIDVDALKKKAVEKGLISSDEAERMGDDDALRLIGTPGLSTAREVTDISGRGVGMDVVFKQVSRFGGYVKIESRRDIGTRITLYIPMNVSIISGLMVYVRGERYIIPSSNVVTTMKVKNSEIMHIHGKKVIRMSGKDYGSNDKGDKIIPIVEMDYMLGINGYSYGYDGNAKNGNSSNDSSSIVIVNSKGKSIGFVVDSFEYMKEVVVKRVVGLNGRFVDATIASDGSAVLILDISQLVRS